MDNVTSLMTSTSSSSMSPYFEEPPWLQAVIIILYETVSLLGITGNAIVCFIVLSHARMRTVTNYFIVNLAVSDLSMAAMCITFTLYSTMYGNWPFGRIMCKLVSYVQNVSVSVSIFTFVAIGVDRYFAIVYPLKPRMTGEVNLIIIVMTWVMACIFALPVAIFVDTIEENGTCYCTEGGWELTHVYSLVCILVQYLIPLMILAVVYLRISIKIWSRQTPGEGEITRDRKLNESKRKLVKLFATVVLIFALCYLPIHAFNLTVDFGPKWILDFYYIKLVYLTCLLIAMSNCFVNPIIYCWMNAKFRNGFRHVFRFLPCISNHQDWQGDSKVTEKVIAATQTEFTSYRSERDKSKPSYSNSNSYIAMQTLYNNYTERMSEW